MLGLLTFILVFGIIVVVHEFGHFYFAKKSGILVVNLPLVWVRKSLPISGKTGLLTRFAPTAFLVRPHGSWGEDTTEIAGTLV